MQPKLKLRLLRRYPTVRAFGTAVIWSSPDLWCRASTHRLDVGGSRHAWTRTAKARGTTKRSTKHHAAWAATPDRDESRPRRSRCVIDPEQPEAAAAANLGDQPSQDGDVEGANTASQHGPEAGTPLDKVCQRCKGSGVDPQQYARRYTNGGRDEPAPCSECGGSGIA
jgi:hypothetical protein